MTETTPRKHKEHRSRADRSNGAGRTSLPPRWIERAVGHLDQHCVHPGSALANALPTIHLVLIGVLVTLAGITTLLPRVEIARGIPVGMVWTGLFGFAALLALSTVTLRWLLRAYTIRRQRQRAAAVGGPAAGIACSSSFLLAIWRFVAGLGVGLLGLLGVAATVVTRDPLFYLAIAVAIGTLAILLPTRAALADEIRWVDAHAAGRQRRLNSRHTR